MQNRNEMQIALQTRSMQRNRNNRIKMQHHVHRQDLRLSTVLSSGTLPGPQSICVHAKTLLHDVQNVLGYVRNGQPIRSNAVPSQLLHEHAQQKGTHHGWHGRARLPTRIEEEEVRSSSTIFLSQHFLAAQRLLPHVPSQTCTVFLKPIGCTQNHHSLCLLGHGK